MPIKTILVHLDTEQHAADLIGIAASIAGKSMAHVTGLHVVPDVYVAAMIPADVVGELIEAQRQANEAIAAKIEGRFRQAVAGLRTPTEWRQEQARFETVADVVMRHGRTADLLVLGQSEQKLDFYGSADTSGDIMLRAGRPVLMVPMKGRNGPIGKRILVAWKDSREAARAVFDAMPFLVDADMVHILTVKQPPRRNTDATRGMPIPAADIAATLAHHDVRCEIIGRVGSESSVGAEILAQVKESGCDMVVMGGYGHSRMREIIFGGATRSLFDNMTVPVLMSH